MLTASKPGITIVTKDELESLADWEQAYAQAKKELSEAEHELKFRRQALAEKVLGIQSPDELKTLSPSEVEERLEKRLASGKWKLARGAPTFMFIKTYEARRPAWAELYVQEMGEVAAARVRAETPVSYAYAVEVTLD